MKIEYFTDTDTLLIELSANEISETRDLNENTLVEFDATGKLVSITIEHAKEQTNVNEFVFLPGQETGHDLYKVAEKSPAYRIEENKK